MTAKLERLRKKLADMESLQRKYMLAGKISNAYTVGEKIKEVQEAIKEAEAFEPRKLSELVSRKELDRMGIAQKMVKAHLAADFLNDCLFTLECDMKKLGLDLRGGVFDVLYQMKKLSSQFAGAVCHPEFAGLSDFMVNNEQLIDHAHILFDKYLDDHLKIK